MLLAARVAVAFQGDADAGSAKSRPCTPCHGPGGNARIAGIPSLAGQPPLYTQAQLMRFRDGSRKNDQMTAFVARLTDADIADLATFYAAQKPRRRANAVDISKVEAGKSATALYQCATCHLADFGGHERAPRLAGQDVAYLRKSMRAHKDNVVGDSEGRMTLVAIPLTDEEIEVLSHFLAALGGP